MALTAKKPHAGSDWYIWDTEHCVWVTECQLKGHGHKHIHLHAPTEEEIESIIKAWARDVEARTQKARGVTELAKLGFDVPAYHVVQTADDPIVDMLFNHVEHREREWFARPCPQRPRHGFLESRLVATPEALRALIVETLAIDPEGEVLCMEKINATASAVCTPTLITVGRGHDGATAGKEGSIQFPLAFADFKQYASISNTPYVETVSKPSIHGEWMHDVRFVQLRDGPSIGLKTFTESWIPRDMRVARIVCPTEDMLAWERLIDSVAGTDTVAYIPNGSMICHAAVHCVLNGVPVFMGERAPTHGSDIKQNTNDALSLRVEDVIEGLTRGLSMPLDQAHGRFNPALFTTHHALSLATTRDGALSVGLGFALLMRAGLAACMGEARYCTNGREFLRDAYKHKEITADSRYSVYKRSLEDYDYARKQFNDVYRIFSTKGNWGGKAYGGPNWANCTVQCYELDKHAKTLCDEGTEDALKKIIAASHQVINACHNGGPLLNKVISSEDFDSAASGKLSYIHRAAYGLYQALAHMGTGQFLLSTVTAPTIVVNLKEQHEAECKENDEESWGDDDLTIAAKVADDKKANTTSKLLFIQMRFMESKPHPSARFQYKLSNGKYYELDWGMPSTKVEELFTAEMFLKGEFSSLLPHSKNKYRRFKKAYIASLPESLRATIAKQSGVLVAKQLKGKKKIIVNLAKETQ